MPLRKMQSPIGVSEILWLEKLPENLQGSLPTIEELEKEFSKELKN